MKINPLGLTSLLLVVSAVCGGGAATGPTQAAPVSSVSACQPPAIAFTNVGLGFPRSAGRLPSVGDVKSIVLFADFPDVPATQTPEDILSLLSPSAENFYAALSYGRMQWTLEPHLVWLRLSRPSAFYGNAIRSYDGHLRFLQEVVALADADVDFSTADSVIVMVPPQASAVETGPAFGAEAGQGYSADGKTFSVGVTSGADLTNWGYLWLNHESGHTMGLPDLYAYQFDQSNYDDEHRFVGGFGLMGFVSGSAPEYFAFERWQLGWLDDAQIVCKPQNDQPITITPVETAGGLKAVVIPLSKSKVLVVESRRPLGFDAALPKAGALVYTVDTAIASGEGALVVYPQIEGDPYRYQSPLAVGESLAVRGVTITVTASSEQGDTVEVTK